MIVDEESELPYVDPILLHRHSLRVEADLAKEGKVRRAKVAQAADVARLDKDLEVQR